MSGRQWTRRIGRLVTICLLLALLPGAGAAAADMESVDVTFTRMDHTVYGETSTLELFYDLAQVPEDYPEHEKVNAILEDAYLQYLDNTEGLEENLRLDGYELFYTKSGEVMYDANGLLSLRYFMEWFMGGVYNSGWQGININLLTGERASLDSLFAMDPDLVLSAIRSDILEYVRENGGWEWDIIEERVNGYTLDSLDFYIGETGQLVICIPEYELAPGAGGPMLIPCDLYYGGEEEAPETEDEYIYLLDAVWGLIPGEEVDVQHISLRPAEQYEMNVFLSNFAEQNGFGEYPGDSATLVSREVSFSHVNRKINDYSSIVYRDYGGARYETLSLEQVNDNLDRMFGAGITDTMAWEQYPDTEYSFYRDGMFYFMPADGEGHNEFAVAEQMGYLYDDLYYVEFSIYGLDFDLYFNGGITRNYYEMTPDQAMSSSVLTWTGEGGAIVRPYDLNGRETYQLVEYYSW